ncbi:MAG: hypothetical protein AABZ10_08175 [Nitrospirota bacterium]
MSGFIVKVCASAAALVLLSGVLYAGSTNDPVVRKREQRQEKRVNQGVKSGELTPREAGRLEREQARIKQDEERMKADGKLTPLERKKLQREQDRASRHIYKEKHDAQKAK